jgi:hypothetical protein
MSKLISSDDKKNESLHDAINDGDLEAVLRVLGEGASKDEVNEVNSSGETALWIAADKGQTETIKVVTATRP